MLLEIINTGSKKNVGFIVPPSFYVGSGIRDKNSSDPGSGMKKCLDSDPGSGIKHPGSGSKVHVGSSENLIASDRKFRKSCCYK
jgi:hypothetical protein